MDPEETEHATVIAGYNPHTDEITLCHWGSTYLVSLVSLFYSNQTLLPTRQQEFYCKNPNYLPQNKTYISKYLPSTQNDQYKSIIPNESTGFKSKLLVVKKPDLNEFIGKRRDSLTKYSQRFFSESNRLNLTSPSTMELSMPSLSTD